MHLFSEAEIMRAFECFHAYLETHQIEVHSSRAEQVAKPFAECIERTVREIATPERIEQLLKDVKQTAREWLRHAKPAGALLQILGSGLIDDRSPENHVLYTLFAGQMRRFSKGQSAKAKQS